MKKYLFAVALILMSTSAMADRVVSASNFSMEGVVIRGSTKPEACQSAKVNASLRSHYGEEVEEYSQCDCEKSDNRVWTCTVEAKLANKRDAEEGALISHIISASNFSIEGALIRGSTKPEACQSAKQNASLKSHYDEEVERYSKCDCAKNDDQKWVCSVDAKIVKKRDGDTSAIAGRMVSASNFSMEGAVIGGSTKPKACQAAKVNASLKSNYGEEVERYFKCDCEENDNREWVCSVDAKLAKKR